MQKSIYTVVYPYMDEIHSVAILPIDIPSAAIYHLMVLRVVSAGDAVNCECVIIDLMPSQL